MQNFENLKKEAAEKAVEFVKPGMVLGLGTGSTAKYATLRIGELIRDGKLENILAIPTSDRTAELAAEVNIPLTDLVKNPKIDITIDGADEIEPSLNVIKGGGGAHLREKLVAQSSKKMIVVADESKLSDKLGEKWAVPVEVLKIAVETESIFLKSIGAEIKMRKNENDENFITDLGNFIIDADFGVIENPYQLAGKMNSRAGIVEQGLFLDLVGIVIIAGKDGVRILEKK
ncbi:MAG: ribose-5-phosphate isomerase RpiA [Melioribacteraceae bacterium]|nr:ribose-5-phosphate isomerase RpiA [Melioribacteraceae bacterium]MCF8355789.1 ribose-5-phosphate isomerase RpiA [Melioribacteraceae bacterium]MCF8392821.1 ribose-5-phosphate isomerase RpiA [Melioribacteraceae bacterium]MCF8418693.1 ribose-5-phosphate isomerase RpiA [Melioribacteraceae bacterium]